MKDGPSNAPNAAEPSPPKLTYPYVRKSPVTQYQANRSTAHQSHQKPLIGTRIISSECASKCSIVGTPRDLPFRKAFRWTRKMINKASRPAS